MTELYNGNIALSVKKDSSYPIVIVDTTYYRVFKEICLTEKIKQSSSLCGCDQRSFVYAYKGTFLQISNDNYKVIYESTEGNFNGVNGVVPLNGGKVFAVHNGKYISIVQPGEYNKRKSFFNFWN